MSVAMTEEAEARLLKHRAARRRIVLTVPLVVLVVLNCTMLLGQIYCEHSRVDLCKELVFFEPTGRINRNARFVLFLSMCQWMQSWTGMFPKWYEVMAEQGNSWWG